MDNKGLIFIPDISGFTRFVNETEINHSRLIIQELLEILINSNEIGLEISEIEGDAILFYKFGESPKLEDLYKQVEKMFCQFHKHLMAYELSKYCQCKACLSAVGLSLKIITHYGEFTGYNVKNFNKLIGKDVIVAHQLLKNQIDQHEYWLVTKNLQDNPPSGPADWMQWFSSTKQIENGEILFHYTQLSRLKNEIVPEPYSTFNFDDKIKMFSVYREFNTDIITLFHAAGDFIYRDKWLEGVKKVEEVNHFLPRVGMKCRYIMENGDSSLYSSSYSYSNDKIEFSETEEKNNTSILFTLNQIADKKVSLTLDFYLKKNLISQTLFNLFEKKKLKEIYNKSIKNIDRVVESIKLPPLE